MKPNDRFYFIRNLAHPYNDHAALSLGNGRFLIWSPRDGFKELELSDDEIIKDVLSPYPDMHKMDIERYRTEGKLFDLRQKGFFGYDKRPTEKQEERYDELIGLLREAKFQWSRACQQEYLINAWDNGIRAQVIYQYVSSAVLPCRGVQLNIFS